MNASSYTLQQLIERYQALASWDYWLVFGMASTLVGWTWFVRWFTQ